VRGGSRDGAQKSRDAASAEMREAYGKIVRQILEMDSSSIG